jgi:hypothetical protein
LRFHCSDRTRAVNSKGEEVKIPFLVSTNRLNAPFFFASAPSQGSQMFQGACF